MQNEGDHTQIKGHIFSECFRFFFFSFFPLPMLMFFQSNVFFVTQNVFFLKIQFKLIKCFSFSFLFWYRVTSTPFLRLYWQKQTC